MFQDPPQPSFRPAETEWHPFIALFIRRLIDGTFADGHLMRRWTGQDWEYRAPVRGEELERDR